MSSKKRPQKKPTKYEFAKLIFEGVVAIASLISAIAELIK